jgi:hypothetical protein
MIKLTTRLGIVCPKCGEELKLKTRGLLGGIFAQIFVHAAIGAAPKGVTEFKCKCGHKFKTRM